MKDRLDELFYNVGRSLYDDEHVLLREKDFEWLIETVEEQQATIDTLSMAHDNLQRELVEIKRLMGKDKHALIKTNIALNKRVQELEATVDSAMKAIDKTEAVRVKLDNAEQQNKRYREVIEEAREYANNPKILTNPAGIEKILSKVLEESK